MGGKRKFSFSLEKANESMENELKKPCFTDYNTKKEGSTND